MPAKMKRLPRVGWREWLILPDLTFRPIKAKVDTGARTSALHAFDVTLSEEAGVTIASFTLHPRQRSSAGAVRVECPVVGFRNVRSSNGRSESRPVIRTTAILGGVSWAIEITLTSRDEMGFRMLLGRSALRRRFVVDSGRSFLAEGRSFETPESSRSGRLSTRAAKKAGRRKKGATRVTGEGARERSGAGSPKKAVAEAAERAAKKKSKKKVSKVKRTSAKKKMGKKRMAKKKVGKKKTTGKEAAAPSTRGRRS